MSTLYTFWMQLTLYTDYSLRVLLYLGACPDRRVTITEMSQAYGVSRNHLVKVVHQLSQNGWITTIRGKSGGMHLAFPPEQINIGAVIRHTEPHMNLLECFDKDNNTCEISPVCKLKRVLYQARKAFVDILDKHTLADVMNADPNDMMELLNTKVIPIRQIKGIEKKLTAQ